MWLNGRVSKRCKRYNTPGQAHELTFSCFQRRPLLSSKRTCEWLVDAIVQARSKYEFSLWGYVFMPEHVHLLISPQADSPDISGILQAIKQPVSFKAVGYLRREKPEELSQLATGQKAQAYRFWQKGGGYDRNICSMDTILAVIKYIHQNPVRRGLVSVAGQWYYSSATCWAGRGEGPLAVDKEDWPSF